MDELDHIPPSSQTTSALSHETIDKDTNKQQDDVKLKQLRAEKGTENHISETLSGDNRSGNTYSTTRHKALLNKKEDGNITHKPTAGASEEEKTETDSTNYTGDRQKDSTPSGKALFNKNSTSEASSQLSQIVKEDGDIAHEPTAGASEEENTEADSTNYTSDRQKVISSWWILCKRYWLILFIASLPLLAVVAYSRRFTSEINITISPSLAVTTIPTTHRHSFPNGWTNIRRYSRLLLFFLGPVKRIFR